MREKLVIIVDYYTGAIFGGYAENGLFYDANDLLIMLTQSHLIYYDTSVYESRVNISKSAITNKEFIFYWENGRVLKEDN